MYTKLYDLHFEVGVEQALYFARNVLGNNAIEFKQYSSSIAGALILCVSDMIANGAFTSLQRDPSLSVYPIVQHQNYMITTQGQGGGHSHSHSPAVAAITTYFDLHIECAIDSATTEHHAKGIFMATHSGGLIVYHQPGKRLDDAIVAIINDMEGDAFFDDLLRNPLMSQYPIPGGSGGVSASQSSHSVSSSQKKEEVKRVFPKDIGSDITRPACQAMCISYDHFLDRKCQSMCPGRL